MNNKFFAGLLVSIIMLASCNKKTDSIFDKTPDQRLADTLTAYQNILTGAANGWKMVLNITGGGAARFYMKFTDQNRVTMLSDINASTGTTGAESSYRLKAVQRPTLIFDTYSYIHLLSDPSPYVLGGETGKGYSSDFEYAFTSVTADTIRLKGTFNGSQAYMVKMTKAESDAAFAGGIGNTIATIQKILNYFKQLTINGKSYEISINNEAGTVTFSYLDASGNVKSFTTEFYYAPTGIVLLNPYVDGTTTITTLTNLSYNATTGIVSVTSGSTAGQISGINAPLKVDVGAPQRWYTDAYSIGTYWYTWNGFHVNGVDDAFGVNSIVNGTSTYYYYLYWPGYYTNPVDIFCPALLTGNSLSLAPAYTIPNVPTFTTDGKAIFKRFSSIGTTVAGSPQDKSNTQLYNAAGYYFVQKGPKAYDMVLASDSKIWLSWIRN